MSTGDLEGKALPETYGSLRYIYLKYQMYSNNFVLKAFIVLSENKAMVSIVSEIATNSFFYVLGLNFISGQLALLGVSCWSWLLIHKYHL